VSDLSTADLMKSFYSHLRAGKAKDEALQAAQVELIRSTQFPHPSLGGLPALGRLAVTS
jgi:CHAT domain-containing protein